MTVFWRKGYEATSIDDLVQATGINRASMYGTFGSKEGLLLAPSTIMSWRSTGSG